MLDAPCALPERGVELAERIAFEEHDISGIVFDNRGDGIETRAGERIGGDKGLGAYGHACLRREALYLLFYVTGTVRVVKETLICACLTLSGGLQC